ncbi:MAG TPA: OmpA family protein [Novosphingobium sp.]|nr:OmpA family protein [Novosphingobium sp.]
MKGIFPHPSPVLAATVALAPLLLAACQPAGRDDGQPGDDATGAAVPDEMDDPAATQATDDVIKKSIIRAEVDTGPTEAAPIEPTQVTVPFPAKGAPQAADLAIADEVLAAPAYLAGGPVTIRGHSDSRGSDAENLAASRRRAEAVRDHLAAKGVPKERMTVIALGEARPIAPNRKLDGTDDPEGRAKNRRVDVRVGLPPPPPPQPPQP